MTKESGFDELLSQGDCLVLVPRGEYKCNLVLNRTSVVAVSSDFIKDTAIRALMSEAVENDVRL